MRYGLSKGNKCSILSQPQKNGDKAKAKIKKLNATLAKNQALYGGLLNQVRVRLAGNKNLLEPQELAQYEALSGVLDIIEYKTEYINDKRINKYNPDYDFSKLDPSKEQIERSTKARKEAGFDQEEEEGEAPEPSKTALKILEEAGLDWKELKGTGSEGLITVADAKKFAADAAK